MAQNNKPRRLTGKEAKELFKKERAIEDAKMSYRIGKIERKLLELRCKILIHPDNEDPSYYLVRHRYSDRDRFILDMTGVCITHDMAENGVHIPLIRRIRYKWYYLMYINEFRRPADSEWVRTTGMMNPNPRYINREDWVHSDKYIEQTAISWFLPKPKNL